MPQNIPKHNSLQACFCNASPYFLQQYGLLQYMKTPPIGSSSPAGWAAPALKISHTPIDGSMILFCVPPELRSKVTVKIKRLAGQVKDKGKLRGIPECPHFHQPEHISKRSPPRFIGPKPLLFRHSFRPEGIYLRMGMTSTSKCWTTRIQQAAAPGLTQPASHSTIFCI
ncbi:hypothetical protein J2T17_002241 [Paenibacillus mucilaginosus]